MTFSSSEIREILFSSDLYVDHIPVNAEPFISFELKDTSFESIDAVKLRGFTLVHILKGQGSFQMALQSYEVKPHCIYFGYPGQIISGISLEDVDGFLMFSDKDFMLKANPDTLSYELFQLYGRKHEISISGILEEKMVNLSREILYEVQSQNYRKEEVLESMLNLHVLYTDRLFQGQHDPEDSQLHPKVKAFLALMNFRENPNTPVSGYADELNISPNHLNAIVKKDIGKSVKTLLKEKVIRKACVLLIHTDLEVKEIAYTLGYSYPQYFDSDFKRVFGKTPLQYRELNLGLEMLPV